MRFWNIYLLLYTHIIYVVFIIIRTIKSEREFSASQSEIQRILASLPISSLSEHFSVQRLVLYVRVCTFVHLNTQMLTFLSIYIFFPPCLVKPFMHQSVSTHTPHTHTYNRNTMYVYCLFSFNQAKRETRNEPVEELVSASKNKGRKNETTHIQTRWNEKKN